MIEVLREYWALVMAGIGLVVWALRVEFATKGNASEIRRIWHQRDEDLRAHKEAREATNEMLREMRADIKVLLRKGGAE